jgi:TPR repeat protein
MNPIPKLLAAAKRGDMAAQFDLATRYREGNDVPESYPDALLWYRKAADAGHPDAMTDLGSMLLNGMGCKADAAEAFKWFEMAAKMGDAIGCYCVAMLYLHGDGVEIDLQQAFDWLSEAARQGRDTETFRELGTMFRFGQGTERNLIAAAEFHLIAAKDGDICAMGHICDYLDELQDIALTGNTIASRCLMEIHNLGLGAKKSMPLTWTWAKWLKENCPPSELADEAAENEEAYAFYKDCLSDDDRKQGERVLKALISARGDSPVNGESPSAAGHVDSPESQRN